MPAAMRTLAPTREPMASQRPRLELLGRGCTGGGATATGGGAAWVAAMGGGAAGVGVGCGIVPGPGGSGVSRTVVDPDAGRTAGAGVAAGACGTAVVFAGGRSLTGTVLIAARRASADWKRFSGSFAMHIRMIWLSAGGRSPRMVIGGGGSLLSCAVIRAYCESFSKGNLPVSISYSDAPKE